MSHARKKLLTLQQYHFLVLLVILGIGVVSFVSFAGVTSAQLGIGILTTLAYVAWGIIHHIIEDDLYPKVVIEYVLIASIVIILLLTIIGN